MLSSHIRHWNNRWGFNKDKKWTVILELRPNLEQNLEPEISHQNLKSQVLLGSFDSCIRQNGYTKHCDSDIMLNQ